MLLPAERLSGDTANPCGSEEIAKGAENSIRGSTSPFIPSGVPSLMSRSTNESCNDPMRHRYLSLGLA
ncbi:hypothetical protein PUN28_019755 [Cardiocondyla obscurior]|uniref:Uncharacterized protein n=1 Tax=Cardiocondyla obscurior TaxID=286306 RepID=A0AAW2ED21_9HYME